MNQFNKNTKKINNKSIIYKNKKINYMKIKNK